MFTTPHFVTGNFTSHAFHLPDAEYSRALDCLVKACTDILVIRRSDGKILLGKRKVEPHPGWWVIGGRMKPGELISDSCIRIISRELGIELNLEESRHRFKTVGQYSYVWDTREQLPKEHGTADISVVSTIEFADEETENIQLDAKEYESWTWATTEEITSNEQFLPALRKVTWDLLAMKQWEKLEHELNNKERNDSNIVSILEKFVQLKQKNTT